jgi:hypothetical protein
MGKSRKRGRLSHPLGIRGDSSESVDIGDVVQEGNDGRNLRFLTTTEGVTVVSVSLACGGLPR